MNNLQVSLRFMLIQLLFLQNAYFKIFKITPMGYYTQLSATTIFGNYNTINP